MVYAARGDTRKVAGYRKVIDFIRPPDDYDDAFEDIFSKRRQARPGRLIAGPEFTIREGPATPTVTYRDHETPVPPSDSMAMLNRIRRILFVPRDLDAPRRAPSPPSCRCGRARRQKQHGDISERAI
jgi:hypothetical protein